MNFQRTCFLRYILFNERIYLSRFKGLYIPTYCYATCYHCNYKQFSQPQKKFIFIEIFTLLKSVKVVNRPTHKGHAPVYVNWLSNSNELLNTVICVLYNEDNYISLTTLDLLLIEFIRVY